MSGALLKTHKIDGKIYDFSSFNHPGGPDIMYFCQQELPLEIDAAVLFQMIHGREFNHGKYKKYLLEDNDEIEPFKISEFGQDILDSVKSMNLYADWRWYSRAVMVFLCACIFECVYIFSGNFYYLVPIAYLHTSIAVCIMHDACHGSLGPYRWWHEVFKASGGWVAGNSKSWTLRHWPHHAYTNEREIDADANRDPIIYRYPSVDKLHFYHQLQPYYSWMILPLLGAISVFVPKHVDTVSAIFLRFFYFVRMLLLPVYLGRLTASQSFVAFVLLRYMFGVLLTILFSISHRFVGVKMGQFDKKQWARDQVETGCTYGGVVEGFITGGTNFHIEHHLFPRACSVHYPALSDIVRKLCTKHGVRYTYYDSIIPNISSTFRALHIDYINNSSSKKMP